MTWARIDDSILTHPKVAGLSPGAGWLWVRALVYCNKHLTDGELVPAALRVLQAKHRDLTELVRAGLLEAAEAGSFRVHDYGQWNETKAKVESRRDAWRVRQGDARARSRGESLAGVTRDSPRESPESPRRVPGESLSPIPSHPIPSGDPVFVVDPDPGTTRGRDRPPATTATASTERPKEARNTDLEARFVALLRGHPHGGRLPWDPEETARVLAYAGDPKPPDQAVAAARRALDEAGATCLDATQTLRLVRAHVERADARDLPGARAGRPVPARSQPRAARAVQPWEDVRPPAPLPPADLPPTDREAS